MLELKYSKSGKKELYTPIKIESSKKRKLSDEDKVVNKKWLKNYSFLFASKPLK